MIETFRPSEKILEIRINRPEALNALNEAVINDLLKIISELKSEFLASKKVGKFRDDFPRIILLTGAGEKAFVAGADISLLAGERASEFLDLGIKLMNEIERLPIPTVAVVQGFCLGGGLELALSCDVIAVSEHAKLGLPEVTLGIIPGFGGSQRLGRRCGIGLARKLILSGEKIDALTALQSGIVDFIYGSDRKELIAFTEKLEKLSPLALEAAKSALFLADSESKEIGMKGERELFVGLLKTNDSKEGMKAFFEKRPAKFLGN
jgi:enoyl-CoA hydratase